MHVQCIMSLPAKHSHHSVTLRIVQFRTPGQRETPVLALCLFMLASGLSHGNTGVMGIQGTESSCFCFLSRQYEEKKCDLPLVHRKGEQMKDKCKFIGDWIKDILG